MVTADELCPTSEDPDSVIREMNRWLKTEGLLDPETVTLFAEQLEKVRYTFWYFISIADAKKETVHTIEKISDSFRTNKSHDTLKRAVVKAIPRQAVLKPSHAIYRLQGQKFSLGDRVIMVQDAAAGGVPLAMKGVVVGLGMRDIDVVWDVPFMGGETLGAR